LSTLGPNTQKKYADINRHGERIDEKTYTHPGDFKNGIARVEHGNLFATVGIRPGAAVTGKYADKSGKTIWSKKFFL